MRPVSYDTIFCSVAGSLARLNILFLNSLLIPESLPKKTILSACTAISEKTIVMKIKFRCDFTIQLENGLTQPRQSSRNHTFTVLDAASYSSINAFLCKCKKKGKGFLPLPFLLPFDCRFQLATYRCLQDTRCELPVPMDTPPAMRRKSIGPFSYPSPSLPWPLASDVQPVR